MAKYYYNKNGQTLKKRVLKILGFFLITFGVLIIVYVFLPLISWQIYFAPVFANQNITAPIPKQNLVSANSISSLLTDASSSLAGVDYTNAQNWFPNYKFEKNGLLQIQLYTISIPKLKIKNAVVSTVDTNLTKHLVNYSGTALPPQKGNAVVFGHSTLPQLYDSKSYKTVFTYLYKLTPGDEIIVNVGNIAYKYVVENIIVVDPQNTTVLEQNYNDSFLTLVTCTPPGTIWKRLIVKARLTKI